MLSVVVVANVRPRWLHQPVVQSVDYAGTLGPCRALLDFLRQNFMASLA